MDILLIFSIFQNLRNGLLELFKNIIYFGYKIYVTSYVSYGKNILTENMFKFVLFLCNSGVSQLKQKFKMIQWFYKSIAPSPMVLLAMIYMTKVYKKKMANASTNQ